jgi:hypothetical protein
MSSIALRAQQLLATLHFRGRFPQVMLEHVAVRNVLLAKRSCLGLLHGRGATKNDIGRGGHRVSGMCCARNVLQKPHSPGRHVRIRKLQPRLS